MQSEASHHLIVTGTGRAGTSFLVRYLTAMGLETHISLYGECHWDETANAGLEDLPRCDGSPERLPYVIKTPWMCEVIDSLLAAPDMAIDAVVIPVRDLVEAASSRIILERQALNRSAMANHIAAHTWDHWGFTVGGAVFSLSPIDQGRILAVLFHQLIERLTKADIPIVLLSFPRLVHDANYLFDKLKHVLPTGTTVHTAQAAHARIADVKKVRTDREIRHFHQPQTCAAIAEVNYPNGRKLDLIAIRRELQRVNRDLCGAERRLEQAKGNSEALIAQLAVRTQEVEQQTMRANQLETDLAQTSLRVAELSTELSKIRSQHLECEEQLAARVNDIAHIQEQVIEQTQKCAALQVKLDDSQTVIARCCAERELFFNSRSWRFSRPARSLAQTIRRVCSPMLRRAS